MAESQVEKAAAEGTSTRPLTPSLLRQEVCRRRFSQSLLPSDVDAPEDKDEKEEDEAPKEEEVDKPESTPQSTTATEEPKEQEREKNKAATASAVFKARCKSTRPGEAIFVVGSHEALGSWSTAMALPLTTSADRFPEWKSDPVPLLAGMMVEYKFIIQREDRQGTPTWQNFDGNYRVTPVAGQAPWRKDPQDLHMRFHFCFYDLLCENE